jgi:hypothetical protein
MSNISFSLTASFFFISVTCAVRSVPRCALPSQSANAPASPTPAGACARERMRGRARLLLQRLNEVEVVVRDVVIVVLDFGERLLVPACAPCVTL